MNRHRYDDADPMHTTHLHVAPVPVTASHKGGRVRGMWTQRIRHLNAWLAMVALFLGIILMGAAIVAGVGITAKIAQIGQQLSTPDPVPAETVGPVFTGCGPDNTAPC